MNGSEGGRCLAKGPIKILHKKRMEIIEDLFVERSVLIRIELLNQINKADLVCPVLKLSEIEIETKRKRVCARKTQHSGQMNVIQFQKA